MSFAKLEPLDRPRPAPRPAAGPDAGNGPRDYLFIAVAALMVVALVLVGRSGGNPLVILAVLPALLALVARATILPAASLGMVVYLAVFPDGLPVALPPDVLVPAIVRQSRFRVIDFVQVAAVAVYFVAYFRLAGFKSRVLATTATVGKPPGAADAPAVPVTRRDGAVAGDEYARAFAQVLGLTLLAAVAWPLVNVLAVEPLRVPPFRLDLTSGNDVKSRFLVLAGVVGFGALGLGSLARYWSATGMRPAVARQYLLDQAWREGRRELNRREKWRAWGRGQLAREPFRFPLRAVARTAGYCLGVIVAVLLGAVTLSFAVRLITRL